MPLHDDKQEYLYFYLNKFLKHQYNNSMGNRGVNHTAEKTSTHLNCRYALYLLMPTVHIKKNNYLQPPGYKTFV